MSESKQLRAALQETLVAQQVDTYNAQQQHCPNCGAALARKGKQPIVMCTLFGKVTLDSPRVQLKKSGWMALRKNFTK